MTHQMQSLSFRHHRARTLRAAAGVTLIELLIAVAIVAILAAIAYPSYQRYVARTQRGAAAACMSQYAQFMERYYTTRLSYEDADDAPGPGCMMENDLNLRYTIELSNVTEGTYTLSATPVGLQEDIDAQCGTLTLDHTGDRRVSTSTPVTECW